mgnify:CR=1 FL=1
MEKFLIIEKDGQYVVEAEDLEDAVQETYNNHTGYRDVQAVVRLEAETDAD